jgi:predicted RNase H-like HicB family nuclease
MTTKQTKNLEYYLSLPYTIELTPDVDGYWFAEIPLLEGCMTNGESREDALAMIDDAKRAWLETALELGLTIPEPESQHV